MRIEDLPGPVAQFRCGELEESYPEAYKAFKNDFLCSIEMINFVVDAKGILYAFHGDDAYEWQSGWLDDVAGEWQDGVWIDLDP